MSADLYYAIAEKSPYATFIFDVNLNRFIYSNEAFKLIFETDIQSLSLADLLDLLPQDEEEYLRNCYTEFIQKQKSQNIEFRIQLKYEEKWLLLTPSIIKTESGEFIIGYIQDRTAENNTQHTLKKYANKKNSVLNILSHDLRGPLGIANTITQVLSKNIKDPHLSDLNQSISKILKQSIDLIKDLTGREFLETTDVELFKNRIDLVVKLKEYFEEYQKSQELTRRTFKFSSSEQPVYINLDEPKFIQVMNNLMTNSLKFTHDDGVISLDIKDQEESVLITFADNGIGIPARFHPTLFAKFTDARRIGLHDEPTVGLGLSIVKTIVEWHKGKIWFESKEGEGTTFYIEIPKV